MIMSLSSYMQLASDPKDSSQFRIIGYVGETERRQPRSPTEQLGGISTPPEERSNRFVHQRLHTLRLSARQVIEQGGIPGQTPPYCPQGPTLFREDLAALHSRSPSPLRNLSLSNYSLAVNRRRSPHSVLSSSKFAGSRVYKMPHAVNLPHSGFQALILCGPGIGLSTFTSVPNEYPKALVNIANRPMIWYVLDWCYRMGVTDITLITPPTSKAPIAAALAQNPYLTALPSPTPDLLAPAELEFNTPTAELLRLPEVQKTIKSDFLLLPCDLICDISGDAFIESYLTSLGGLGGVGAISDSNLDLSTPQNYNLGGEASGRRGGLSVWYNTSGREESVKHEECDFMGTVGLDSQTKAPFQKITDLPKGRLRKLVWTTPMSELLDSAEEDKSWKIRQSLLRRYGAVKCLTQYRDSHIYFFPYWVKEFAMLNEDFESVSEDLVGTWTKEEWRKPSYRARYGAMKIFKSNGTRADEEQRLRTERPVEEEIDLLSLSSTQISRPRPDHLPTPAVKPEAQLASRVKALPKDSIISPDNASEDEDSSSADAVPLVPPMLSYILSSDAKAPLVRRVDSTPLLLSVSLLLAKLPTIEESTTTTNTKSSQSTSPLAHPSRIAATATIAPRTTISRSDTLIDSNTTISTQCVIKSSVIGSSVFIGLGSRLTNCVVMDGATIGEKCVLTGTVVGKKAKVGNKCGLTNCEVQDGNAIADETEGKGEKYLLGGLEDGDDDGLGFDGEDDDDRQMEKDDDDDGDGISL